MRILFNNTHLDIIPADESYRYRQIMGEHSLTLYFSLAQHTEIPTGATCQFQGETYVLNLPAKIVKQNDFHFDYTLTMDSLQALLGQFKFKNTNDHSLKFPFTANPRFHLQMLIDNLNLRDSGWQIGECIESVEKLISYNHNSCAEVLQMIAETFETEYEIIGKTIHLCKVEHFKDNPLPLSYGKGNGFRSGVGRITEQSRITRLFVQGGERNIDRSKYGNKELLLPKNQEYTYEETTYVSDNQGFSISIKNAPDDGFINEQSLDLSHIYPKRQGTISQVFEVNPNKNLYDFADETIPADCDFSALQIKGEKMVVYFESGMLSGREFEVQNYKHSERRFKLVSKEEDGTTMPNAIFKPEIGDKYAVFNMQMPDSYISDNATKTGASWEMMKQACKYFYKNQTDIFTFNGELDGIWAKKNWENIGGKLVLGGYIHFSDTQFQPDPVAIRIVGLKEYVNNPHSPQIELSNKVQGKGFMSEIRKIANQEVKFEELNKQAISFTKRRWRDTQETISQIEGAMSHFNKSINPATVQTMMTLIGDKSLQFEFVVSKQNPIRVSHLLYFNKEAKQLHAGGGWLKHYTLGIGEIKSNRSHEEYKYWQMMPFVSGRLDDADKKYYLYAKVSKSQEIGNFLLSENTIDLEQEADYYHLLVGTLNSEYQEDRGFARLYGFTEILPGQMKIDKISSGDGRQFIEFLPDRININANVTFTDGSPALNQIKTAVSPDLLSLENRLKAFSEQKVNELQLGGRNLAIGSSNGKGWTSHIGSGVFNQNNHTQIENYIYSPSYKLKGNTEYVLSFWSKNSENLISKQVFVLPDDYNNVGLQIFDIPKSDQWTKHEFKFRSQAAWGGERNAVIRFDNNGSTNGQNAALWIKEVMLIEGNKSVGYSTPIEDIETQITAEQQARQTAINEAKSATEAYARTQADLAKTLAIAQADNNISEAEQRQIANATQKLQEAKTFAVQKVNELQISSQNIYKGILHLYGNDYNNSDNTQVGRIVVTGGRWNSYAWVKNAVISVDKLSYEITNRPVSAGIFVKAPAGMKLGIELVVDYYVNPKATEFVGIGDWQWIKIENITKAEASRSILTGLYSKADNTILGEVLYKDFTIVFGNKAPEGFSSNPQDIEKDLQHAKAWADMLDEAEKANVKKISEIFKEQDNFVDGTSVVHNTIATGAVMVGNITQGGNAGINGSGNSTTDVRFWAGSNFANRANAPFRVLDNGEVHATNAHISGQINATSGNVGGFDISANGLRAGNFTTNGLALLDSGIIFRNDLENVFAGIGTNMFPSITGIKGLQRLSYEGNDSSAVGLYIKVRPMGEDYFGNAIKRALQLDGNFFQKGASAIFEEAWIGQAHNDIIKTKLSRTHTYCFSGSYPTLRHVYLPSRSEVQEITGATNVTFDLKISCLHNMSGTIRINGVADGYIRNTNGDIESGGNGYWNMGRGDSIVLRYCEGNYYIISYVR
ncbi:hypothetical protein ACILPE_06160 [Capnocytophaga canimorsus]|uniref:hypothetical protein n=1 Tax=Capnocytophaga canimorsus TaxID=28188 RepID=UPI0037CF2CCF